MEAVDQSEFQELKKQVAKQAHELMQLQTQLGSLIPMHDANARLFSESLTAHDIMIFVLDRILVDMAAGTLVQSGIGKIDFDHYMALTRPQKAASEDATQEEVSVQQDHPGAVVFGG